MTADAATVLLIDDNEDNRELLAARFAHDGFRTVNAVDAERALQLARAERPR